MINNLKKNIKLPVLAALIILLCAAFYGCAKEPQSSAVSKANQSKPVSSASVTSSKAASSNPAASKTDSRQSSSSAPTKEAQSPAVSSSAQYSKYVTITIDATKGKDGVVASGKKVGIIAGDTVFTVLKRYCDENKILIAAQKTGNGEYVSSIDGVMQFACGSQSGWIYSVSGVFPGSDCNSYKLNGGENIKWVYTTDLGKSEGAAK